MTDNTPPITWPKGKRFAFTVFDDTDRATLENNRAIYGLLRDLGMRTTKTLWIFDGQGPPMIPGVTCSDPAYLDFMRELQRDGFELSWHNATWETSDRATTLRGLDRFRELFGHDPHTMANHASNGEGLYWGHARFSGWRSWLYRIASRECFDGHVATSPRFWGDLCQKRIRYVRNFVFPGINTLRACPMMPYHDAQRPFAQAWFASSEAADIHRWNALLSEASIDQLEAEGGACIAYTHFGKDFHKHGQLNARFVEVMKYLATKNAWFPTTVELLDYLAKQQPRTPHPLAGSERATLENRWLRGVLSQRIKRR